MKWRHELRVFLRASELGPGMQERIELALRAALADPALVEVSPAEVHAPHVIIDVRVRSLGNGLRVLRRTLEDQGAPDSTVIRQSEPWYVDHHLRGRAPRRHPRRSGWKRAWSRLTGAGLPRPGTWFAVPLPDGGYASALLARVERASGLAFGTFFFFGPRRASPAAQSALELLQPSSALLVQARLLPWPDQELSEDWPQIGLRKSWDPTQWPCDGALVALRDLAQELAQRLAGPPAPPDSTPEAGAQG